MTPPFHAGIIMQVESVGISCDYRLAFNLFKE